jgi:PKD repeat protein
MSPLNLRERLEAARDQKGLTVIEMVIALTIVSTSFLALSFVLFGALDAFAAARTRSSFVEIANAEVEKMRSSPFSDVGVRTSDPNYVTAYPGGGTPRTFEGRDAVVVTSTVAPSAVSVVTTSPLTGIPLPYTIRRWITWTDASGGTGDVLKRLTVRLEWREENATRSFRLTSLLYPGGIGPPVGDPAPTAALTATPLQAQILTSITFDASASSDPEGESLTYSWDFGDTTRYVGASQETHVYADPGRYTAKVTVLDPHGGFDIEIVEVVIGDSDGNFPPDAQFVAAPLTGSAPLTVNVDAGASTDPNPGDVLSYSWSWGDGSGNGSGAGSGHTYLATGSYTLVLTVTDTGGLSDTASTVILVADITCEISAGFFENPEGDAIDNDILVHSNNNRPVNSSFTFNATTNFACSQARGRLDLADGSFFEVTLAHVSTSGTNKIWKGTGTTTGNDKFSLGTETGEIRASSGGPEAVFTYEYEVHT